MTLHVKVGSTLRTIQTLYVKVGSTLRQLHSLQVKVGSVMRELLVQYFSPWSGNSIGSFLLGSGNVSVSFTIFSDGSCSSSSGTINSAWISPAPAGVGSAHQIMYTVESGPSPGLTISAATAGTWYSLSSSFAIQASNNTGTAFYNGSVSVRIQIRRVADNAVVCNGVLNMNVQREL